MKKDDFEILIGYLDINFKLKRKSEYYEELTSLARENIRDLLPDSVSDMEISELMSGEVDIQDLLNSHNERIYK
jgi:hypothetical protein